MRIALPTAATLLAVAVMETFASREGLTLLTGWSLAHGSVFPIAASLAVVVSLSTFWFGRFVIATLLTTGAAVLTGSDLSLAFGLVGVGAAYLLWAITRMIAPRPSAVEQADAADEVRVVKGRRGPRS